MYEVRKEDGLTVVVVDDVRFAVMTPSRRRTHIIRNNPLLPVANVFVHDDEYDTYARDLRDIPYGSLLTHKTYGLPAIRNHMLRVTFRPDLLFVYQSDDDFVFFNYMMSRITGRFTRTDECLGIIHHTACAAAEVPTGLFGYASSASPQEVTPLDPFDLRGRVNVDFGILDRDLRFDETMLTVDDADLFLQALVKWGVVWKDSRFFTNKGINGAQAGGLAHIRNSDTTRLAYERLAKKWGTDVVLPPRQRGNVSGVQLRIPR